MTFPPNQKLVVRKGKTLRTSEADSRSNWRFIGLLALCGGLYAGALYVVAFWNGAGFG